MLNFLIVAAVVATALVLLFGILTMARGGEFNRKYANKIMRLRILVQAVAIVLILIGFWIYGSGH
ncbi:MAG: twin transmembrane helix small protein [Alphaproteobacteria bacterium]|nr:MAG: twin transmembrane helix small protein [Alphaproteobacteria bacterium]